MDINLVRNDDAFVIMAAENKYKIKIISLALHVKKIANKPSYIGGMNKKLDDGERVRYPLVRSIVKTRTIPKGASYANLNAVFSGSIPNTVRIQVGL